MNTLTKMALGLMGQLKPQAVAGDAVRRLDLPPPQTEGGLPLMQSSLRSRSRVKCCPTCCGRLLASTGPCSAGALRPVP
jgi:hypothetical protein